MSEVQGIYIALLGRPADPAGLSYFGGLTHDDGNLALIQTFAGQKEYNDRFTGMDDAHVVNAIYNSLLGRDGETSGVNYWVDQLKSGTLNVNNVALAILDGAQGADKATVNAKIAAADLFTSHLDLATEQHAYTGATAAAIGRAFINSVDASHPGTATLADTMIAQIVASENTSPKPSDPMMEPANWNGPSAAAEPGAMMHYTSAEVIGYQHGLVHDLV